MDGKRDWMEEEVVEEEEPGLQTRSRRELRALRTQSSLSEHEPATISGSRSPPSSPRLGSRSRGSGERPAPHSVRTRRSSTAPRVLAAAGGAGSGGAGDSAGGFDDGDPDGAEDTISSWMRDQSASPRFIPPRDATTTSASMTAGRAEEEQEAVSAGPEFSFPPFISLPKVVDAAEVFDQFDAQFWEATMGVTAGPRTAEIKRELFLNRRVVDVVGLERWLRKTEARAELAWFTELCSRDETQAPPLELFECAFRALQSACSDELHRAGAWIGPVAVPDYFFCPVSKKVMDNPVVITSGKTVDLSELEKWWTENKRICPVTGEVLRHRIFIHDALIAGCISRWRAGNRISDLTTPTDPPAISPEEEAVFKKATLLLNSPSSSKEDYEAILRLLEQRSFLHLFGRSPEIITKLACVLPETCVEPNPELDNIILEIFAKAASYNPSKEVFGDDRYAIPVLIARAFLGPVPTRVKCAEILGLLADNYYNKIKIGELGGFAPLMELLLVEDIGVKKKVAVALANVCEAQENWSRFVREGVADAAISLMRNDKLVEEAHSIFLQAEGFELAMVEILDKLISFEGDEMCKDMAHVRLWNKFLTPGQRRRPAKAPEASSSSSSSSQVSVDDVEAIVSWLQNKSYNPRTYNYVHRISSCKEAT